MQRGSSSVYVVLAALAVIYPQGASAGYGRYIRIYDAQGDRTNYVNLEQVMPYGKHISSHAILSQHRYRRLQATAIR